MTISTFQDFERNFKLGDMERESISFLTLLCTSNNNILESDLKKDFLDSKQSVTDARVEIVEKEGLNDAVKVPQGLIQSAQQFLSW